MGFIIIILLILLLFSQNCVEYFTLIPVRSDVDGETYPVAKYEDKEIAANNIGEMNLFTIKLLKKLKQVYLDKDLKTNEHIKGKTAIDILLKRYSTSSLKENDSNDPNKTSFTTDKGRIIALCLREKTSGKNKLHDINLVKFVLLHELAHIITTSYDHNLEFWANFKFLIQFCEKHDLYYSVDYANNNTVYCGLQVAFNPVFDPSIPSYFI